MKLKFFNFRMIQKYTGQTTNNELSYEMGQGRVLKTKNLAGPHNERELTPKHFYRLSREE